MGRLSGAMAWFERRGRDRGLRGPSGAWLAVWIVAASYRRLRKWTAPETTVVRETLEPGQRLVITNYPKGAEPDDPAAPSSRRARPKARKRSRG